MKLVCALSLLAAAALARSAPAAVIVPVSQSHQVGARVTIFAPPAANSSVMVAPDLESLDLVTSTTLGEGAAIASMTATIWGDGIVLDGSVSVDSPFLDFTYLSSSWATFDLTFDLLVPSTFHFDVGDNDHVGAGHDVSGFLTGPSGTVTTCGRPGDSNVVFCSYGDEDILEAGRYRVRVAAGASSNPSDPFGLYGGEHGVGFVMQLGVTPVPEPTAAALMAPGLFWLGLRARRGRAKG